MFKTLVAAAGTALALATLTACGNVDQGGNACTPKGGASSATTVAHTVQVVSDPTTAGAYQPKTLTVKKGDSVEWDWTDQNASHTVTADDGSFDSGLCGAGTRFIVTFASAGSFTYHCTIHAAMTGSVTVQ